MIKSIPLRTMDPSTNDNSTTNANDVEVDNGDLESPTPGVQPVPTSHNTRRWRTYAIPSAQRLSANLTTGEEFFPVSEPSQAMAHDELAVKNLPSTQITNADSTTTRESAQWCDGYVMVRKTVSAKPTSDKPAWEKA